MWLPCPWWGNHGWLDSRWFKSQYYMPILWQSFLAFPEYRNKRFKTTWKVMIHAFFPPSCLGIMFPRISLFLRNLLWFTLQILFEVKPINRKYAFSILLFKSDKAVLHLNISLWSWYICYLCSREFWFKWVIIMWNYILAVSDKWQKLDDNFKV